MLTRVELVLKVAFWNRWLGKVKTYKENQSRNLLGMRYFQNYLIGVCKLILATIGKNFNLAIWKRLNSVFLVSANKVGTGTIYQFLYVCLLLCISGLLAYGSGSDTSLIQLDVSNEGAWLSNPALRYFNLAEQCHTQKFHLRCFNSDFDAVKSKFGLLLE